jgi:hypothetical protein
VITLHHGHNGWPSMPELSSFLHLIHSAGFDVQRQINNNDHNNDDNNHDSYNDNSDNENYSDYNGNDSSYDVSFNSGTLTE